MFTEIDNKRQFRVKCQIKHRESIQSGRRWKEQFQSALVKQFLEVTFGWLLFSSGVVGAGVLLSYSKGRDSFQLLLWVVRSLAGGGNTCLFADHTIGSYAREKTSELVNGQSKWTSGHSGVNVMVYTCTACVCVWERDIYSGNKLLVRNDKYYIIRSQFHILVTSNVIFRIILRNSSDVLIYLIFQMLNRT